MSRTKGTVTNKTKLASWDIDYYLSLSDAECIVCLTEKEMYLLRNPLAQMEWLTRWQSLIGTPPPDIENIAESLSYKLASENCCEVDYCAEIVDCIETSESVQLALNKRIVERGTDSVPDDNPLMLENVFDTGCDLDIVFGQVSAVWGIINQTTIDFLQILSAAGNPSELGGEIISAIPVLGLLPIDEFLTFAGKFGEWTLDTYEAFLTLELENSIKCDLFCLAIEEDNCTLTTAQLIDYFASRVGALSDVKVQTIEDFINFIIGLPEDVAVAFVCSMALTQLYITSIFEKFLGFSSINAYIAFARLGDPSDDWIGLCEDCDEFWTHVEDLTISDGGFSTTSHGQVSGTGGVWTTGVGWQASNTLYAGNVGRRELVIVRSWTEASIKRITYTYDLTKGTWANPGETQFNIGALDLPNENRLNSELSNGSGLELVQEDIVGDYVPVDGQSIRMLSSLQSPAAYSGSLTLTSVTYEGFGVNPFL